MTIEQQKDLTLKRIEKLAKDLLAEVRIFRQLSAPKTEGQTKQGTENL
jgi:hypothetical protein